MKSFQCHSVRRSDVMQQVIFFPSTYLSLLLWHAGMKLHSTANILTFPKFCSAEVRGHRGGFNMSLVFDDDRNLDWEVKYFSVESIYFS